MEERTEEKKSKSLLDKFWDITLIGKMGILGAALGLAKAVSPETDLPLKDIDKIYDNLLYIGNSTLKGAVYYTGFTYMASSGFRWIGNKISKSKKGEQ